jgi:iduronate 2-sulfatase
MPIAMLHRPAIILKTFLPLLLLTGSPDLSAESPRQRPNVLFLAVDDLKPMLGCYGDQTVLTPHINSLAKDGTVFLNSHCNWPVCGPSRASLMTSLRPEAVGVMDLKTDMRAKNPDVLTLPQHFLNHGYTTAGAGKIYDPRCVDSKDKLDAPSWTIPFAKLPYSKIKHHQTKELLLAPDVRDDELTDGQIALSGIRLMRQLGKAKEPFFLAIGFKKPHLPFIAPRRYWDLYQRDQFKLARHRQGIANDSGYVLHDSPEFRGYEGAPKTGPISEALQRESLHAYHACVSYIDAQVGLLLRELKTLGLEQNTAIVLWGDHGFHLGDHSMWGKHSALEHATRSPLIIRPPNGTAIAKTTSPVEFVDIYPTLCELTGLPVPDGLNGRSLVPLLRGTVAKVRAGALTVFKKKGTTGYSHRGERYRYTEWVNKFGKTVAQDLFDYQTDPDETKNLAGSPEHRSLVVELARQLRAEGQGCDRLQLATRKN